MTNEFWVITGFAIFWMVVALLMAFVFMAERKRYRHTLKLSYNYTVELLEALKKTTALLDEAETMLKQRRSA